MELEKSGWPRNKIPMRETQNPKQAKREEISSVQNSGTAFLKNAQRTRERRRVKMGVTS
jgi:hypothetical protein